MSTDTNTDPDSARYWNDLAEVYQREHGRRLAAAQRVEVNFRCISMDSLADLHHPPQPPGHPAIQHSTQASFDLIHSTCALPFSAAPAKVIADAASMLKPGGTFLLTTGHPLDSGEWIEISDCEDGVFIPDGFHLEPDVRMALDDRTISAAQYWPLSQLAQWIRDAGLVIERLLEPEPMPLPDMSEAEILAQASAAGSVSRAVLT